MHKLTFTTQELQMIVMAFHALTIKGNEARQVGLLLDKVQTELEKLEMKKENNQEK